jgi:hypothetical protein
MSQSIKSENASTLKPIEDILESISFSNKSTNNSISNKITAPQLSIPTTESFTSSLAFKIIIILIILLVGIVGYTYLEKEVNQLIANIKNYFETIKYRKEENKELKKQKELEEENTPKEQTTEDIIKDVQSDINENKKNKNKKEEPVNYTSSTKLNVSDIEKSEDVEEYQKDALQKALNDASQIGGEVIPDGTQLTGKKGWCFIGSEKLNRTCAEIGVNDICMSGEIYPTKDVCINPNLRA